MDSEFRIYRPLIRLIALLLLAFAAAAAGQPETGPELLSPGEAFRLEAARPTPARVRLIWTIAPGYYLYRDRFRFEDAASGTGLPTLTFPAGQPKDDPYFGPTEIFRDHVVIDVGLDAAASAAPLASLRVVSQGCADIGVCFPPQVARLDLAAGAGPAVHAVAVNAGEPLAALNGLGDGGEDMALPFIRVRDNAALDAMLTQARRRSVPALLEFYADWCIPCRKMEAITYAAPMVRGALADTLLLRADVSANLPADAALLSRFALSGPPAILFFDRRGQERIGSRVIGFVGAAAFAARIRDAIR